MIANLDKNIEFFCLRSLVLILTISFKFVNYTLIIVIILHAVKMENRIRDH